VLLKMSAKMLSAGASPKYGMLATLAMLFLSVATLRTIMKSDEFGEITSPMQAGMTPWRRIMGTDKFTGAVARRSKPRNMPTWLFFSGLVYCAVAFLRNLFQVHVCIKQ
jgi:hypothetical protein